MNTKRAVVAIIVVGLAAECLPGGWALSDLDKTITPVHGYQGTFALIPLEYFIIYIVSKVLMIMLLFTTYIVRNHADYSERVMDWFAIINLVMMLACLASELIFFAKDEWPEQLQVGDIKAFAFSMTAIGIQAIAALAMLFLWAVLFKVDRKRCERTWDLVYLNLGSALLLGRTVYFCSLKLNIGTI